MVLIAVPVAFGVMRIPKEPESTRQYVKPFRGLVPDEKTAIAIGEAVLRAQAGDEYVETYKPIRAKKSRGDGWSTDCRRKL